MHLIFAISCIVLALLFVNVSAECKSDEAGLGAFAFFLAVMFTAIAIILLK